MPGSERMDNPSDGTSTARRTWAVLALLVGSPPVVVAEFVGPYRGLIHSGDWWLLGGFLCGVMSIGLLWIALSANQARLQAGPSARWAGLPARWLVPVAVLELVVVTPYGLRFALNVVMMLVVMLVAAMAGVMKLLRLI
ncbi:MAG: hypothetical protein ACON4N_16500 [Myxococcota bacterium]